MSIKPAIRVSASILIRRQGYEGMTIRDICDMLDISPGNYSYHFPKKQDLMRSILKQYWDKEVVWYERFFDDPPTIKGFLLHFNGFFEEYDDHRQILRLHYHQHADLQEQSIKTVRREYYTLFLRSLVQAEQMRASEEDILFLSAFMQFLVKAWSMDVDSDEDAINSHIYMLAQQLYYFCSESGQMEISQFLESLE